MQIFCIDSLSHPGQFLDVKGKWDLQKWVGVLGFWVADNWHLSVDGLVKRFILRHDDT